MSELSNPFSEGGGGHRFESHVQASFVVLMLSGGYAPYLPCWPITKIRFQAKIDGFATDDFVIFVEDPICREQRKFLAQVKSSITITRSDQYFKTVMRAAWRDFNNPEIFKKGKDIIALITGAFSATDARNVSFILDQARHTASVEEFFRKIAQAKFSPSESTNKLGVIQEHLKSANHGSELSKDELYEFLRHFYLLSYDFGVIHPLIFSHISQFQPHYPDWVWKTVLDKTAEYNHNGGTLTSEKLPEDLLSAFKNQERIAIQAFKKFQSKPEIDWTQHPEEAAYLALGILIGGWDEQNQYEDCAVVAQFFGISYDEWLRKAQNILQIFDSPLSLSNGIWKVDSRAELWRLLGSRIFDQNLDAFQNLAINVLKEPDPAFELSPEERYLARVRGKIPKYSHTLQKSVSEGLALLGSQPDVCRHYSQGKAEAVGVLVIREVLSDADWTLWGSLGRALPNLAEAAPNEFLNAVEKALQSEPCPFDQLFSQESNGITGVNYLTDLLWALEALAWDEQYLVRVCVVLGELISHEPGGQWMNRPSNSLTTILLPWRPQTLAPMNKRKVAVKTLFNEFPNIAWNLMISLLPQTRAQSFGSYKPRWRKIIPDNWKEGVSLQEYWQQVSFYAELAISKCGSDIKRLSVLINNLDRLPEQDFNAFIADLSAPKITELTEQERAVIWDDLTKFISRHKQNPRAEWALPAEQVNKAETVARKLAPTNLINLYKSLFGKSDLALYKTSVDLGEGSKLEAQRKELDRRRENAVIELFEQNSAEGMVQFAESVTSPEKVGYALGVIADSTLEKALLPHCLDSDNDKHRMLINNFVWRRYKACGWKWCDSVDKSGWTPIQIAQFLSFLPFDSKTWDRVDKWIQENEGEYWSRVNINAHLSIKDLPIAISKLISYGRPYAAISCLDGMRYSSQLFDTRQQIAALFSAFGVQAMPTLLGLYALFIVFGARELIVLLGTQALLAARTSNEPSHAVDTHHIVEIIKFLQRSPFTDQDALFMVEWAYLSLLDCNMGYTPQLLESRLASDPEFFCQVIQRIYLPQDGEQSSTESTNQSEAIAKNAVRLLDEWRTLPGTGQGGTLNEEKLIEWVQRVKAICIESGHLDVALIRIGKVLTNAPPDPGGLWIHCAIASLLNDREAENMRIGYRTGRYNARGVHWVDPTGESERALARQFRSEAEDVENAGFQRFAVTLGQLVSTYDQEAEQVVNNYKNRDDG
ncbi:MAG: hypothetical protein AAF685_02635 [Cyanobacteria bacterium P01_C01_bin.89]